MTADARLLSALGRWLKRPEQGGEQARVCGGRRRRRCQDRSATVIPAAVIRPWLYNHLFDGERSGPERSSGRSEQDASRDNTDGRRGGREGIAVGRTPGARPPGRRRRVARRRVGLGMCPGRVASCSQTTIEGRVDDFYPGRGWRAPTGAGGDRSRGARSPARGCWRAGAGEAQRHVAESASAAIAAGRH